MTIEEILALEISDRSVKKINNFLGKTSKENIAHAIAVSQLASFYNKTNQITDSIKIINSVINDYNESNQIVVLNRLIEITMNFDRDLCLEAIERKKVLINSYDQNLYYEDMINFYKDNFNEKIKYINLLLQDDTTKENRLKGLSLLATAYHENNEFNKFASKLETTKELSLELGDIDTFESLIYYEAAKYYYEEDSDKALEILNNNTVRSTYYGNMINLLILKIHFQKGNYKKCTILEAEYEEFMDDASNEVKKEFYNLCIELYTLMKNRPSIMMYENKLMYIKDDVIDIQLEVEKEEKKIKTIKVKKEKLDIKEESKQEAKPIFKNIKKVNPSINEMSDFYQEVTEVYQPFYTNLEYREQLRLSLIKLNEQVIFTDCYIVTKEQECFHFKKERLYNKDKEVNKEIIKYFHDVNTEIISFNTQKDNLYDPFFNRILEYNTAVIFPIFNMKCVGAIYFISETEDMVTGKLNYEKLHNFAKFFNSIHLVNFEKEMTKKDVKAKLEILISKGIYYGYLEDDYFYIEKQTQNFLTLSSKVPLSELLSKIVTEDYYSFHQNYNNLTLENNYLEQIVTLINGRKVLFKVTKVSEFKVLFVFEDYTKIEENKESLITTAYHNPISNLKNNNSLGIELHKYFDIKKFSSVLINFKDLKKYTYLYQEKFTLDILKYIGVVLPKFNEEYDYYHINNDKMVVLIKNINDKRALKQIVTKLDKYLLEELSSVNSRLIPRFNYGVYRSLVDTKEKSLNKMLEILSDAIQNSEELYNDNIGFYDVELYKERFLREQLVTYISESIDKKTLNVYFTQCVNTKENLIEYYEAKININKYKVEDSLLQEVIKRRNLTTSLEQYLLYRTFHEMDLIFEKTGFSINVMIQLDEYSLLKKSFVNYLETLSDQFKVNKKNVIFKISKIYSHAVENITQLINAGFQVALDNLEDLSLVKPNYYLLNNFETINEFNVEYIKSLSNVLSNLDVKFVLTKTKNNEIIEHFKEISYFSGSVYKQQMSYLDIINIFKENLGI